jgi:hypothetical protein
MVGALKELSVTCLGDSALCHAITPTRTIEPGAPGLL